MLLSNISAQQLTERYAALDLGLGPRSISTTAGSYALGFDTNIETFLLEKEIEDSFNYLGLNLGLSFGKYRSLSHNLYFDVPIGGQGSGRAGYSIGWNFAIEAGQFDILLRPAIGIATGNSNITFGSIQIDTISQLINGTEFNDVNLSVDLEQNSNYVVPELKATFLIAQKLGIFVSAAYDYDFSMKRQNFSFGDTDGVDVDIDDTFLRYSVAGTNLNTSVTDNIYVPGGLRLSFGISIYYNKDLYD